jgi:hypothetical protein
MSGLSFFEKLSRHHKHQPGSIISGSKRSAIVCYNYAQPFMFITSFRTNTKASSTFCGETQFAIDTCVEELKKLALRL